jgi:hypothetical protein
VYVCVCIYIYIHTYVKYQCYGLSKGFARELRVGAILSGLVVLSVFLYVHTCLGICVCILDHEQQEHECAMICTRVLRVNCEIWLL